MHIRRSHQLMAAAVASALILAACGSDSGSETTSAPTTGATETTGAETTTPGSTETTTAGGTSLKGICPDTVANQRKTKIYILVSCSESGGNSR